MNIKKKKIIITIIGVILEDKVIIISNTYIYNNISNYKKWNEKNIIPDKYKICLLLRQKKWRSSLFISKFNLLFELIMFVDCKSNLLSIESLLLFDEDGSSFILLWFIGWRPKQIFVIEQYFIIIFIDTYINTNEFWQKLLFFFYESILVIFEIILVFI